MHTLCFDLMMLSHVLSAFCSCETVHDVDIQGFVTLPLRFNDNNIERKNKKRPQWNSTVYIQVCQPSLFSHPSRLCLLCITAKLPPLRWTK